MDRARLFCLLLAVSFGGGALGCAHAPRSGPPTAKALASAHEKWSRLRARFPANMQGVFTSRVDGDRPLVIVMEPSPRITERSLRDLFPEANVLIEERPLGFDGWLRDALIILPPTEPRDLDDDVARLHEHLNGTSYRAFTWDADDIAGSKAGPAPAMGTPLAPRALAEMTLDSPRTWRSVDGSAADSMHNLLAHPTSGVFESADPGVVAWILRPKSDICDQAQAARQFAVEADVLLGAVAEGNGVAILGRQRTEMSADVPPLRHESIVAMLGADASNGVVSQSYERTNLFAGKLRSHVDWAPILLSDRIVDSEVGSLLNVTDQLLKSWSLSGEVTYQGFSYPTPAAWPFDEPINRKLRTASLTFNWNTNGTVYELDTDERWVFARDRIGAMTVSYKPDDDGSTAAAPLEARAYDYFAARRDPYIFRAAEYAALFSILKNVGITGRCATENAPQVAAIDGVLRRRCQAVLSTVVHRAPPTNGARQRLEATASQLGDPSMELVCQHLAGTREVLAGPETRPLREATNRLHRDVELSLLIEGLVDREAVEAEVAQLARRPHQSWVGTPALVRSQMGNGIAATGGHNIGADVVRFELSTAAQKGEPRFEDHPRKGPVIHLHPDDADRAGGLVPVARRIQGEWSHPAAGSLDGELRDALAATAPQSVSPAGRPEPRRRRRFAGEVGWWKEPFAEAGPPFLPKASRGAATVDVMVTQDKGVYTVAFAEGVIFTSQSRVSAMEMVADRVVSGRARAEIVTTYFEGFTADQADAFSATVTIKARQRSPRRLASIRVADGSHDRRLQDVLAKPLRPGTATVELASVAPVRAEDGPRFAHTFEVRRPGIFARITLFVKERLPESLVKAIKGMLARLFGPGSGSVAGSVEKILNDLATTVPEGANIYIIIGTGGDDLNLSHHDARSKRHAVR